MAKGQRVAHAHAAQVLLRGPSVGRGDGLTAASSAAMGGETFPEIVIELAAYRPHRSNYNRHGVLQIEKLRASLRKFGQPRNVVVWRNFFVAGHGVAQAAVAEGWSTLRANEIPAEWPEARVVAFLAADNELARLSDPDELALAQVLEEARAFDEGLLLAMGYNAAEYEALLAEVAPVATGASVATTTTESAASPAALSARDEGAADLAAEPDRAAAVLAVWGVVAGDVWQIGPHRLGCGDATNDEVVDRLVALSTPNGLGNEQLDALVTDPPYSSGGQFRSDRSRPTGEKYVRSDGAGYRVDFGGDNRDQRAFLSWAALWLSGAFARSKPGAVALVFTDWRQLPVMSDALQHGGWVWRNVVTWWKPGIRMQRGRFSGSAEYVLYGSNGVPTEGEESPQNVLQVAPVSEKEHIAQKPVALVELLLGVTQPGAIIYEPFAGSGTTLIACAQRGRVCRALELSPAYCALILQRMRELFPDLPIMRLAQLEP